MGQLPDVPSQSELWKSEKNKYRHWIILFGIGIITIFALYLTGFIMNLVDQSNIKQILETKLEDIGIKSGFISSPPTLDQQSFLIAEAAKWFRTNVVIFPAIIVSLLGIAVTFYFVSVFLSYHSKTFAKLSGMPNMLVVIGAFLAFYQILSWAWRDRFEFEFSGGILLAVTYCLLLVVAILLSSPITKIRRTFLLSARVEVLKNDPAFRAMQEQMNNASGNNNFNASNNNSFYNPFMGAMPNNVEKSASSNPNIVNGKSQEIKRELSPQELKRKELELMPLEDLLKIAEKLSISGSKTMEKPELINNILRVTGFLEK